MRGLGEKSWRGQSNDLCLMCSDGICLSLDGRLNVILSGGGGSGWRWDCLIWRRLRFDGGPIFFELRRRGPSAFAPRRNKRMNHGAYRPNHHRFDAKRIDLGVLNVERRGARVYPNDA